MKKRKFPNFEKLSGEREGIFLGKEYSCYTLSPHF